MKLYQKGLILIGLFLVVIYIPYRITYMWLTDSNSCTKCHESEPYYVSWTKSAHQSIECRDCHETRGPFHRLDTTFRGIRDVGIHVKGDYSFLMKSIYYDSNCINCHLGDFKPESEAPMMPENHANKIKAGTGCNKCHRDTAHKNGLLVDANFEALSEE